MNRLCSGLFASTLLAGFALACNSTGVGNPPRTGSISLAIVADDDPQVTMNDAGDAGTAAPASETILPRASLRHAVLVLGSIRWLPCAANKAAIESSGPFLVDLVTGETRPTLPEIVIPKGGLCGFSAPLTPARDTPELTGRSLFFSGVRADGVPFLLFANMEATLHVRAAAAQNWGEGEEGSLSLLWALQPRRWASLMELDTAQDSPLSGSRRIIPIDVNRNPLLYAAIRARLAGRSGVFVDRDHDGFLDARERAVAPIGTGDSDTASDNTAQ